MTKTNKTTVETETPKTAAPAKPVVEMPQKQQEATLFVFVGDEHMQFTFPMEKPNEIPVAIQAFIKAFQSRNEHILWSPVPNALTQLIPARCTGWDVKPNFLVPTHQVAAKTSTPATDTPKGDTKPTDGKPAA